MLRNSVDHLLKGAGYLLAFMAASSASAVDIGYSLGYTGIYTDNPRQESADGMDEWINNANLGFELEQKGAGLEAEIDSLFTFSNFKNDTRDDVLRGDFDGVAIWHIRPGGLEWQFQELFTSLAITDQQSENPINQQNTNAFSTGPRFYFRVGERNTLQLDLRYEDYFFEESPLDSQRLAGLISWIRPLSPTVTSSVNFGGSTVDYENQGVADNFDRVDLFWRGEFESSSSELILQFGGTDIKSDGPEDSSGATGEIDWNRTLGAESSLRILLSSDFTDTGDALFEGAFDRPDVGGVQVNANVFRRTHGELTYRRDAAAGALDFSVFATKTDFETGGTDRQAAGATAGYRRPLTARATATLSLRYGMTEFDQINRDDDDIRATLGFDYLLSQALTLTVGGSWSERDSTDPISNFEEVRGEIGITYGRPLNN